MKKRRMGGRPYVRSMAQNQQVDGKPKKPGAFSR
jgi:hypothetical protein